MLFPWHDYPLTLPFSYWDFPVHENLLSMILCSHYIWIEVLIVSWSAASAFGQPSGFGQVSALGQSPGFGQASGFGQPSAFGQPAGFGQSSSASTFGMAASPQAGLGTPPSAGLFPFALNAFTKNFSDYGILGFWKDIPDFFLWRFEQFWIPENKIMIRTVIGISFFWWS